MDHFSSESQSVTRVSNFNQLLESLAEYFLLNHPVYRVLGNFATLRFAVSIRLGISHFYQQLHVIHIYASVELFIVVVGSTCMSNESRCLQLIATCGFFYGQWTHELAIVGPFTRYTLRSFYHNLCYVFCTLLSIKKQILIFGVIGALA